MKKFKSVRVDDIVCMSGRTWRVTGVYLGGTGQENMVGIECLDRSYGYAGGHGRVKEMLVPEEFIPHEALFRSVDHDDEAKAKPLIAVA